MAFTVNVFRENTVENNVNCSIVCDNAFTVLILDIVNLFVYEM